MPQALIQTNFREATLDPSETKRAPAEMGSVSKMYHGIARQGNKVYIPKRAGGEYNVHLDLGSGVLQGPVAPNPEIPHLFKDVLGDSDGMGDVFVADSSSFWTSPLFELERMMAKPLTQLDLLQVDNEKGEIMHHYTAQAREKLGAFFAKYRETVERSRLGKPTVERFFQSALRTGNVSPEMLTQIIGGQLLKTLQATYSQKGGKR